jgi:hypothetical protein
MGGRAHTRSVRRVCIDKPRYRRLRQFGVQGLAPAIAFFGAQRPLPSLQPFLLRSIVRVVHIVRWWQRLSFNPYWPLPSPTPFRQKKVVPHCPFAALLA